MAIRLHRSIVNPLHEGMPRARRSELVERLWVSYMGSPSLQCCFVT